MGLQSKSPPYLEEIDSVRRGSYIALSHRWTEATKLCCTTTSNLETYKSALAVDELPRVFQEAIAVARHLEVPYIWIDSICIVQEGDHQLDWAREAGKMAAYYHNALFTIAALRSERLLPAGHSFESSFTYMAL